MIICHPFVSSTLSEVCPIVSTYSLFPRKKTLNIFRAFLHFHSCLGLFDRTSSLI
uniref:Uncharacterized protein n=1 Tax=Arundo donax TaxID=35708 RepID=A0A0A8ZAZ2_ARUDO